MRIPQLSVSLALIALLCGCANIQKIFQPDSPASPGAAAPTGAQPAAAAPAPTATSLPQSATAQPVVANSSLSAPTASPQPAAAKDAATQSHPQAADRAPLPATPSPADALPTIDLATPTDDLWQRIRQGFAMPDLDNRLVARHQAWFLNHPQQLINTFARSRRYLYYIVDEVTKRGMPTEIALLPVIESSFNPMARSPARAIGMWQFIPATGRNYNLERNWWQDERRDIIASTRAALDYLEVLYKLHGDWQLALASYNYGENGVARAIARNQKRHLPTNYSDLKLPRETQNYLPKLQAVKNLVKDPALFGLALEPIPNKPYFSVVNVDSSLDIATAAQLAEIPLEEFIALNPAWQRPLIRSDGKSALVLPADKAAIFLSNLTLHESQDKPLVAWQTHTLKDGETLASVAKRYKISLEQLKKINRINARTRVHSGQTLLLPTAATQYAAAELVSMLPKDDADSKAVRRRHRHRHRAVRPAQRSAKPAATVQAQLQTSNGSQTR